MKIYYGLQVKRLARLLPCVTLIAVLLLAGAVAVLSAFARHTVTREENTVLRVGVAGDTDNPYFEFGMTALQTLDSSRFAVELVAMEENAARRSLESGDIAAYVVVPEGFTEAALRGEILPIPCVVSAGTSGMVSLFKAEIADVVRDLLVESQKGIYGLSQSLAETGQPQKDHADRLALRLVTLILHRDKLYEAEEHGGADGLPLLPSLICGVAVALVWLIGLPYASALIRRDTALCRVLSAKGYTPLMQTAAEYAAYVTVLVPPVYALAALVFAVDMGMTAGEKAGLLLAAFPLVMLAAAFLLLVFYLVRDIVSGMLAAFFGAVALSYVSGCLYPLHTFPVAMQTVGAWLPTAFSHRYLAALVQGEGTLLLLCGVLGYTLLFFAAAVLVRYRRLNEGRGGV
ncbi:MAG: ABC transporter permease [Ruminococcaceae bacterium]|nr:ABC transporter permease [Oscillospiraceae bacterium]